jgi:hypothetical protein
MLLLGIIGLVAMWLVSLLLTSSVPRIALERFHLQTGSFAGWSVQQIVPSMYNFENEFEFQPDRPVSPAVREFTKTKQLNHFPLRVVTFFDYRFGLFHEGNGGKLKITSRYGHQQLVTDWRVINTGNGLELKLLEKKLDRNLDP